MKKSEVESVLRAVKTIYKDESPHPSNSAVVLEARPRGIGSTLDGLLQGCAVVR